MYKTKNKKGQALGAAVGTIVGVGLLLLIGILLFGRVDSTIDMSAVANENITDSRGIVSNTVVDGFELAAIGIIVLVAAVLIGIVFRAFR